MKEFEKRVKTMRYNEMVLSVKKDNSKAIKAYHKFGLSIKEEHGHTFVMHKVLQD
jgi:ribosomal protein S18 acetylase RimI-like enzyme